MRVVNPTDFEEWAKRAIDGHSKAAFRCVKADPGFLDRASCGGNKKLPAGAYDIGVVGKWRQAPLCNATLSASSIERRRLPQSNLRICVSMWLSRQLLIVGSHLM